MKGEGEGEGEGVGTWHDHVVIVPFLSASSGSPWPTFHSCPAFVRTEMPASRAE